MGNGRLSSHSGGNSPASPRTRPRARPGRSPADPSCSTAARRSSATHRGHNAPRTCTRQGSRTDRHRSRRPDRRSRRARCSRRRSPLPHVSISPQLSVHPGTSPSQFSSMQLPGISSLGRTAPSTAPTPRTPMSSRRTSGRVSAIPSPRLRGSPGQHAWTCPEAQLQVSSTRPSRSSSSELQVSGRDPDPGGPPSPSVTAPGCPVPDDRPQPTCTPSRRVGAKARGANELGAKCAWWALDVVGPRSTIGANVGRGARTRIRTRTCRGSTGRRGTRTLRRTCTSRRCTHRPCRRSRCRRSRSSRGRRSCCGTPPSSSSRRHRSRCRTSRS